MNNKRNTIKVAAIALTAALALPNSAEAVYGKPGIKLQREARDAQVDNDDAPLFQGKIIDRRNVVTRTTTTRRASDLYTGPQSPTLQRKFTKRIQPNRSYRQTAFFSPNIKVDRTISPTSTYDRFEGTVGKTRANR